MDESHFRYYETQVENAQTLQRELGNQELSCIRVANCSPVIENYVLAAVLGALVGTLGTAYFLSHH